MGAVAGRVVWRHLAPATRGFLRTQALQLLPAAILAESDALVRRARLRRRTRRAGARCSRTRRDIAVDGRCPWLLAAAGAVVPIVFAINLATLHAAASGPTAVEAA